MGLGLELGMESELDWEGIMGKHSMAFVFVRALNHGEHYEFLFVSKGALRLFLCGHIVNACTITN